MAMHRRVPLLTATSAAAVLALTGCGLFGGDDEEPTTEETTQEQTTEATTDEATSETETEPATEEATDSATETEDATSSASPSEAADGEAPTDLSNSTVMGALNGQTVDGVELTALPVSMMESSGYDLQALLEEELGNVTVDPASCEDPVRGSFMGGVMQSNMGDGVVAVDTAGTLIITVHSFESVDEAETDLEDFRTGLEDCADATMTVDGSALPVELSEEDLTVEGAETAVQPQLSASGGGENLDVHSARMVYGNSVVTVLDSGEYQGQRADYEAVLTEVVELLQQA